MSDRTWSLVGLLAGLGVGLCLVLLISFAVRGPDWGLFFVAVGLGFPWEVVALILSSER